MQYLFQSCFTVHFKAFWVGDVGNGAAPGEVYFCLCFSDPF